MAPLPTGAALTAPTVPPPRLPALSARPVEARGWRGRNGVEVPGNCDRVPCPDRRRRGGCRRSCAGSGGRHRRRSRRAGRRRPGRSCWRRRGRSARRGLWTMVADLADRFLEHAVGRGVGDHQGGQVVAVQRRPVPWRSSRSMLPSSSHLTGATVMPGEHRTCRVGAVGRGGDQADVARALDRGSGGSCGSRAGPAYSPWEPAFGCRETAEKPVILASQPSRSAQSVR